MSRKNKVTNVTYIKFFEGSLHQNHRNNKSVAEMIFANLNAQITF